MSDENVEYVKDPLMSDATGIGIKDGLSTLNTSIAAQNSLLAQIVRNGAKDLSMTWGQVKNIIASRSANLVFSIGDQFTVKWSDGTTEYDVPLDVTDFGTGYDQQGNEHPKMTLQWHYTLPFDTCYNPRDAFYVAGDSGLAAGTYNVVMGYSNGTVVKGKTYQFTLANALPKGGQLLGFFGAWDSKPENWKVYSFADCNAATATETVAVTEGSGGSNLGTFLEKAPNGDLNSLQRVAYGSNNPDNPCIMQYLNTDSDQFAKVWKPQDKFSHVPCDAVTWGATSSKQGFLKGFPEDFLAVIGGLRVDTCTNYVCDGGTGDQPNVVSCYPKFYLPSLEQMYINCNESSVNGKEGSSWPYNRLAAGTKNRLPLWQTFPQMRSYAINAKTTPQGVFLRSPSRGGACGVFSVSSSGILGNAGACFGYRVRPACDIWGIKE